MKYLRTFLLSCGLIWVLGWIGNYLLFQYRYQVVLKSFLAPSTKPYLLLGSSRLYHNLDLLTLHDSVQIMSKPNLYGMDIAHILHNIDLTHYQKIILEYQPIHISGEKNQVMFWDPTHIFFSLKWCFSAQDYIQTLGNTFLWRHLKAQFSGFKLPPRVLQWPMGTYPDLQKAATWEVKKSRANPLSESMRFPVSCPNPAFYQDLRTQIPQHIEVILVYPFGHPQRLSACSIPKTLPIWDLSTTHYSPHDLFDDRHLNPHGSKKMTVLFNRFVDENTPSN